MPPRIHTPKWDLKLKEFEKPLGAAAEDSFGSLTDFFAQLWNENG